MGSTLRSTGAVRNEQSVAAIPRRDRFLIAGCILLVTALSWAYLVHLDHGMTASAGSDTAMAQMGMIVDGPWRASDVAYTSVMWAVMMVGMMSASAAPVLLLFAGMQSRRAERDAPLTVLFALGYVTVWLGFSVCAALAQWALHDGALLSSTMSVVSPRLGGAILIAAGAYQLTPVKGACLRQCQSPVGFLLGNWRDGATGALQMGIRHGIHCLGCCWALMCVLFVVGVMNLTWVGALAAVILLEKSGRVGVYVARVGGVALIAAGVLVAAR
jgi:predicted metal-binding membrane protein